MQKLNSEKLNKDFWINKFLPIFSLCFFIASKFFFNFLLWRGRTLPPEPGDVFNYYRWLRSIEISYLNLTPAYTAYTFILGNIAKIFSISVESVFYYSFWAGFLLLAFVLWKFFKYLKFSPVEMSLSFFVLSFYTGHGSFHGFYWVAPSFFSFLIFLYLFSLVATDKKINLWFLGFVSLVFPLIHGTGVFALSIFVIYLVLYTTLSAIPKISARDIVNNMNMVIFKKVIIVIILGVMSYLTVSILLPQINNNSNQEADKRLAYVQDVYSAPEQFSEAIMGALDNAVVLAKDSRYSAFAFNYLNKIIPHPLFIILWLFIFWILFKYKQYKILALYFAVFIFSLISSLMHYKGARSLLYLWPITYILIAVFFYHCYDFISKLKLSYFKKILVKIIFVVLVAFLFVVNILYGFWYIGLKNYDMNSYFNMKMFDDISLNYDVENTKLYFDNYFPLNAFLYKNYEKEYDNGMLQWDPYQESIANNQRVIIVLEDDSIFYQEKYRSVIIKKILQKLYNNTSDNRADGDNILKFPRLSINDKLNIFGLPPMGDNHKVIYKDANFYIFELLIEY